MSIRTLGKVFALAAVLAAGYGIFLLVKQWEYLPIGPYEVRRNRVTGKVQVKAGEKWAAFETDPYAAPLTPEELKRITIKEAAWGGDGILCARIVNVSDQPLKGRLGFSIVLRDAFDNKWVKERTLRQTIDLPARSDTPFVLNTGMETPDTRTRKTAIFPVPTNYSGSGD